jgi:hypothetical protein
MDVLKRSLEQGKSAKKHTGARRRTARKRKSA